MARKKRHRRPWLQRTLVLLVLGAVFKQMPAQEIPWGNYQEDPFWWAYVPQFSYIKTDVEVQQSTYKLVGGGVRDWDQLSVMPSIGIKWSNYFYHPDLLNYSLLLEPGYDFERYDQSGSESETKQLTLDGTAMMTLLAIKPYSTSITLGRSHEEMQSDFFDSQSVNLESWNVQSGYRSGPVPVTLTVTQSDEDRSGDGQDFTTDQFKVGLHASNSRKDSDLTVLDYQFNHYDNTSGSGGSGYSSESSSHLLLLTDKEYFKRSTLASSFNFNEREAEGTSSSDLNGSITYNRDITPHMRGFLTESASDSFGGGYTAYEDNVVAGINHQLFESLASHIDLHGTLSDNNSLGSILDSTTYGVAASENYNKILGKWGHLSINNSASFDLTNQQSNGGEVIIPDESYAIPTSGPMIIRLNTPLDVSITEITKNNTPLDPSEWRAITTTDPWQVQFFSGGTHSVASGDTLLVTYVVRVNPSGSYSTTNYTGAINLRFWNDKAGVRASYLTTENHTESPGFVLQNIEQYQVGTDAGWGGVHADASYTDQRSTLYSYRSYALSEVYSRPLSPHWTVGLDCYQQWNNFPVGSGSTTNQPENLTFYSYMLHTDWRPTQVFNLAAESGLQQQRGSLADQNLFAARIYLNWAMGKLEIHLGYEHENLQYVGATYTRNYAFLKMRRNF